MDVKNWRRAGRVSAVGVTMTLAALAARADETAYVADHQGAATSTLVIADDGDRDASCQSDPFVVVGDVVFVEPSSPTPRSAPPFPASRPLQSVTRQPASQIAIVGSSAPAEPLRAERPTFVSDGAVTPAGAFGSLGAFSGEQQPLRRSTTLQVRSQSGGRTLAERLGSWGDNDPAPAPAERRVASTAAPTGAPRPASQRPTARAPRERPGDVQSAIHEESAVATGAPRSGAVSQPAHAALDPTAARLVEAHQLSLHADQETEYSQIIQLCSGPAASAADPEQRKFAAKLAAWALNRRGEVRSDEGQIDLAMADFRASLEFDPEHWRTLHNRGVTHAQNGQFAEAFDDVSQVIELNPEFSKAYANRATLYVQAGDLNAAWDDYSAAIERDGGLVAALVGRGRIGHLLGELEHAEQDFTAAIAAGACDASIFCSRGDLLADLGRYDEAMADYARAIEQDDACAHAYRNGAWLLATCPDPRFRDAENALFGARQALECGYGQRHAALDALAAALANAGQFEEALVAEQQAIDVAPAELKEAYEARLQMYEAREPYRTSPVR